MYHLNSFSLLFESTRQFSEESEERIDNDNRSESTRHYYKGVSHHVRGPAPKEAFVEAVGQGDGGCDHGDDAEADVRELGQDPGYDALELVRVHGRDAVEDRRYCEDHCYKT